MKYRPLSSTESCGTIEVGARQGRRATAWLKENPQLECRSHFLGMVLTTTGWGEGEGVGGLASSARKAVGTRAEEDFRPVRLKRARPVRLASWRSPVRDRSPTKRTPGRVLGGRPGGLLRAARELDTPSRRDPRNARRVAKELGTFAAWRTHRGGHAVR